MKVFSAIFFSLILIACSTEEEASTEKKSDRASFQGTVHYISKGSSKNPFKRSPDTIHIQYTDKEEIYRDNLNREYRFTFGSDSVISLQNGKREATFVNTFIGTLDLIEHSKYKDTILGYTVHKLRVSTDDGWTDYYYAPELYLNPKNYANYRAAKINQVYDIIKAVPLRRVYFTRADSSYTANNAYLIEKE